jgi:glycosyltransferase involved in cell wall biosynthesis
MLNAILCVWNEEDIIASTVKNAYAQGCDKVFIIDNDSSDRTVQQAKRAGGIYHATFTTDVFDETQKTVYLNKCVLGLNDKLSDEHNWWLYIDADEFPDFHTGKTIKEMLADLPDDVRAVGAYCCNHTPTHKPYSIPGLHPIDFMPVGSIDKSTVWKYSLLRHDRNKPPLYSRSGAHTYNGNGVAIKEANVFFYLHHFYYRRPEVSRKRLEALILPDAAGKRRIDWIDNMARIDGRVRSGYHARLGQLDTCFKDNRLGNLKIKALDYDFKNIVRWYDPGALDVHLPDLNDFDYLVWKGTHAFFLGDYDTAMFRFNDAIQQTEDKMEISLLLLGIARCYALQKDPMFNDIMKMLENSPFPEIKRLAAEL